MQDDEEEHKAQASAFFDLTQPQDAKHRYRRRRRHRYRPAADVAELSKVRRGWSDRGTEYAHCITAQNLDSLPFTPNFETTVDSTEAHRESADIPGRGGLDDGQVHESLQSLLGTGFPETGSSTDNEGMPQLWTTADAQVPRQEETEEDVHRAAGAAISSLQAARDRLAQRRAALNMETPRYMYEFQKAARVYAPSLPRTSVQVRHRGLRHAEKLNRMNVGHRRALDTVPVTTQLHVR
jgi:hypothetical protein